MIAPVRLKLSRRAGFDLQALSLATNGLPAVNCSRRSKLGNPFVVGLHGTRETCVRLHQALLSGMLCVSVDDDCIAAQKRHLGYVSALRRAGRMRGQNMACWCHGKPCHGDNLLAVFNAEATA